MYKHSLLFSMAIATFCFAEENIESNTLGKSSHVLVEATDSELSRISGQTGSAEDLKKEFDSKFENKKDDIPKIDLENENYVEPPKVIAEFNGVKL